MLHYKVSGKGTALVLLHGFCESMMIWEGFEESLSKRYRLITIDLPGFGKSSIEMEDLSIDGYAQEVCKVLDHLNVAKCILIGHSMGGYVALAFAEQSPQRLLGMGLIHSSAYADDSIKKEKRDKAVAFLQEHGTEAYSRALIPVLFAPHHEAENKEQIEKLVQDMADLPPQHLIQAVLAMRNRPDRTHILKAATCPVLFLVGKKDSVISLESAIAQSALPADATVHYLASVGHMGMFEASEKTRRIMDLFASYCM